MKKKSIAQVHRIIMRLLIMICQMLDWGASDFGTDLGRCHFIGAVQKEEESIKVREGKAMTSLPESNLSHYM